ncbi:MAG: hypothetical protein MJZ33_14690 [Paludibacteraceae bacterium]|nr:hypothetical protein [Paludibacteraceae bacterium]
MKFTQKTVIFHMVTMAMFFMAVVYVFCIANKWSPGLYKEKNTNKDLSGIDSIGHKYTDLGLPSGILWATCNIGATKPEEYGNYFAWGEIAPKDVYDWHTYKWGLKKDSITKYNDKDGLTILLSEDDAATANWGGKWRMPTSSEIDELVDNCQYTWTEVNGVKGAQFSAKNGRSIFIPASGNRIGSSFFIKGCGCDFWSSSLYERKMHNACAMSANKYDAFWWDYCRSIGFAVRAVCAK